MVIWMKVKKTSFLCRIREPMFPILYYPFVMIFVNDIVACR
jgi:hypothetical protein